MLFYNASGTTHGNRVRRMARVTTEPAPIVQRAPSSAITMAPAPTQQSSPTAIVSKTPVSAPPAGGLESRPCCFGSTEDLLVPKRCASGCADGRVPQNAVGAYAITLCPTLAADALKNEPN